MGLMVGCTGAEVAQEAREAELAAMPNADRRENRSSFFRERDTTGGNFRPGDVPCSPLRTPWDFSLEG